MAGSNRQFGPLLGELPRRDFETLVSRHGAARYARGFLSWTQLVAMLFSRLPRVDSLRDICNGPAFRLGKLSHLEIAALPQPVQLALPGLGRPVTP